MDRYIMNVLVLFNLKTRFLLIAVNMIYINQEADFREDTKWQDTAPRVTYFCHFAAVRLLSGDWSQI